MFLVTERGLIFEPFFVFHFGDVDFDCKDTEKM